MEISIFLPIPRTTLTEAMKRGPGNLFLKKHSIHTVPEYRSCSIIDLHTTGIKIPMSLHEYKYGSRYQHCPGINHHMCILSEKVEYIKAIGLSLKPSLLYPDNLQIPTPAFFQE